MTVSSVGTGNIGTICGVSSCSASMTLSAEDSTTLLPQPITLATNTITQLAMLMTKSDQKDQDNDTRLEDAANKAASQDDQARVQEMTDKADQDLAQGWANGLGDALGGVLAIGGALAPSANGGAASSPDAVGVKGTGFNWSGLLSASSKVTPGVGTIVGGQYKAHGDQDEAQAAKSQAASDADVRQYNAAQNRAQADADAVAKVEQALQGILQTQEATTLRAAGG